MKVKLLKKIRKDWSVYKVTNIGARPTESDKFYLKAHGYPFFKLISENDWDFVWVFKTQQECKDHILKTVRKKYYYKMKPKNNLKQEKVWHVQ